MIVTVTDRWRATYPGAVVGLLGMQDADNTPGHPALHDRKRQVEQLLRTQYAGFTRESLRDLERIKVYDAYYKAYDKTYHVLLQLESFVLKGKSFGNAGALVEVMFMAEVKNQLLTAGHDLDAIVEPVTIDVAAGTEAYVLYNGKMQAPKAGDMMICDAQGITSCILHGPDQRTRIAEKTRNVLFAVYAPAGIGAGAVRSHLEEIRDGVFLVSPAARVTLLEIYEAR